MTVVSDTSPVTALLQIDRGNLLPALFDEVLIPSAVHAELLRYHNSLPDFLHVRTIQNPQLADSLCQAVDRGEAEAIVLAEECCGDYLWMKQVARNLTDAEDGFVFGKRYVLMDRDGKFSPAFQAILKTEDVEPVLLPPRSPNLNAHLERFHRSVKEECLERMICFGETSLRKAVAQFLEHYHGERNHQALANQIIVPGNEVGRVSGDIQCRERLGGLLRYYYRKAA